MNSSWLNVLSAPDTTFQVVHCGSGTRREWKIGPRVANEEILHHLLGGRVEGTVGGKAIQLGAGDSMWLPSGVEHELSGEPRLLNVRVKVSSGGSRAHGIGAALVWKSSPQQGALLRQLIDAHLSMLPYRDQRFRGLLCAWLANMAASAEGAGGRPLGLSFRQRNAVMHWAQEHLHLRPSPAELAEHLELSADYFSRVFKRTYGESVRTWLLRQRVLRAAEMVEESDESIQEIAFQLGYDDPFLFSRQFKQIMGVSPAEYRKTR